jgi:hypothetical protein
MFRNESKLRKVFIMVKNFKRILTVVLVVGYILLVQGCGTDPAVWAAVAQGINSGLTGGSSSGSSSSYSSSSSNSSYYQYDMTIYNNTGYTVWYIYMSPSSSSNWGSDWLGSDILRSGDLTYFGLPSGGSWDIKLVDSDGDAYIKYGVSANDWIIFTMSDYVGRN